MKLGGYTLRHFLAPAIRKPAPAKTPAGRIEQWTSFFFRDMRVPRQCLRESSQHDDAVGLTLTRPI